MRFLLTSILSLLLLLITPLFGQSSQERPESVVIPVSSVGDVSNTRKLILQNTLEDDLKTHFRLVPQEKFEEVQEKVFEKLDYEECTEDQCIIRIQEMLQVENVFHLQIIGEGQDTQLSLSWRTLGEKRKEEEFCEECGTRELRKMIGGLVGKKKVFTDEPVIQKIEKDKTEGLFLSVGLSGTILTSWNGTSLDSKNLWNIRQSKWSHLLSIITLHMKPHLPSLLTLFFLGLLTTLMRYLKHFPLAAYRHHKVQ